MREIGYQIRKTTIQKTSDALSEIIYRLGDSPYLSSKDVKEITKRHNCSSDIMTYAVRTRIIVSTKKGYYRSLIERAEPIHARIILEARADQQRASKKPKSAWVKFKNYIKKLLK
jgi:hypothetical protein